MRVYADIEEVRKDLLSKADWARVQARKWDYGVTNHGTLADGREYTIRFCIAEREKYLGNKYAYEDAARMLTEINPEILRLLDK